LSFRDTPSKERRFIPLLLDDSRLAQNNQL